MLTNIHFSLLDPHLFPLTNHYLPLNLDLDFNLKFPSPQSLTPLLRGPTHIIFFHIGLQWFIQIALAIIDILILFILEIEKFDENEYHQGTDAKSDENVDRCFDGFPCENRKVWKLEPDVLRLAPLIH